MFLVLVFGSLVFFCCWQLTIEHKETPQQKKKKKKRGPGVVFLVIAKI